MEVIKLQRGQVVARQKDKVKEWYLIQEGTVVQKLGFAEVPLEKDAVIGILENGWFLCNYIARTDVTLVVIPGENAGDLKTLLAGHKHYRRIFLQAVVKQRQQLFMLYDSLETRSRQFHVFVQTVYNDYKSFCSKLQLDEQAFPAMEYFNMLEMKHRAARWEIDFSNSLMKKRLAEYLELMEYDDNLCVGAIMEASAQMRRTIQGIGEIVNYLSLNRSILLSESKNDMFYLYFDLAIRANKRGMDLEPVKKEIFYLTGFIEKVRLYGEKQIADRVAEYEEYDFTGGASAQFNRDIDITSMDCLSHIMEYAGYGPKEIEEARQKIDEYRNLPDILSTDTEAYKLRKQLSPIFFDIYFNAFLHAMDDEESMTPIVEMFLYFGFLDVGFVGEEHAKELYDLTGRMKLFHSEHVYTIYDWLKNIYRGHKEPSKNDFDLDFQGYLLEKRKNGELTRDQVKSMETNQVEKVKFEINNMFASADRITYGKITTFCPILGEYDLINSVDKMAVTVERLENALNDVRSVDFSLFYREVGFNGPPKDILNHEDLMHEVLPDIILMPNAGTKAMMWQETAGKRRDTPARCLFPIFTVADLDEMMLETAGRFRWEMCRKIQGVRWNDIRERSLTAEYCDYLQFYRKNHDLSADAKDKLKNALARAKNNYREVFVRDYVNWIKYESKGSFRLNKVAREILQRYCQFSKGIRAELKSNPMHQNVIPKFEMENTKKVQRLNALYEKYKKAGGDITPDLKENLLFYQL